MMNNILNKSSLISLNISGNLLSLRNQYFGLPIWELNSATFTLYSTNDTLHCSNHFRNGLILAGSQLHLLRLNGSTLKANIVGLGDYINEIGADVGRLAKTLERFVAAMPLGDKLVGKNAHRWHCVR